MSLLSRYTRRVFALLIIVIFGAPRASIARSLEDQNLAASTGVVQLRGIGISEGTIFFTETRYSSVSLTVGKGEIHEVFEAARNKAFAVVRLGSLTRKVLQPEIDPESSIWISVRGGIVQVEKVTRSSFLPDGPCQTGQNLSRVLQSQVRSLAFRMPPVSTVSPPDQFTFSHSPCLPTRPRSTSAQIVAGLSADFAKESLGPNTFGDSFEESGLSGTTALESDQVNWRNSKLAIRKNE